ncbi:conserved hypothetical protein [Catenulispora acidiphila DSM 44928]|uniref:Uncharacterized protein n=1 Tax=Catenulispora acidiphila (strain DSM 44928 / JCM 14897 / NBRC 102108 / NRRL B-24433 / ID139908) TaxID=479433 RepID=C7QGA3_CATAD|nr:hypothetical protein [Catenulispora acidiphila]ACU72948.1 conserved hypothetical protein [Catenulispora acidiphila DSM 44928]
MTTEPKSVPPRAGGVGGRASARPAARAFAALLAAIAALMIAIPAASAATAQKAAAPVAAAPIRADPAPQPSPSPSGPGIVLGPGAPTPTDTVPAPGASGGTSSSGGNSDPSFWDIPGQIEKAINDWFASLVTDALNPVLNLLGSTVLSTPDVTTMPRVGQIWTTMALLANGFYVLFVLAGGVIVMTHETLQTRYAMKDIAPRLFAGFLVGNASLAVLGLIIHLADSLAAGIMGQGLDPKAAGTALAHMITGSILNSGGIFLAILGLVAAVMAVVLLVTYMVRVALMVLLAVAAPVALACHALPQTDGMARLWWRAVIGTLAIQLGQSLTLVTALRIFLDPGGQTALGFPTGGGLTDLLVFITLFFILIKIPFWVGRSIFGRSQLLAMAKGIATYKLMGAAGLRGRRQRSGGRPSAGRGPGPTGPGGRGGGGRGPGGPLVPAGPRPRPGGRATVTVTRVQPNSPRVIAGEVVGTRALPAVAASPGPVAALPMGTQDRLAKRQAETASKPKPRVVQPGLFPPVARTPRPGPPSTLTEFVPPPPPRSAQRQPALFDRSGQITPAASPAAPTPPPSKPSTTSPARRPRPSSGPSTGATAAAAAAAAAASSSRRTAPTRKAAPARTPAAASASGAAATSSARPRPAAKTPAAATPARPAPVKAPTTMAAPKNASGRGAAARKPTTPGGSR